MTAWMYDGAMRGTYSPTSSRWTRNRSLLLEVGPRAVGEMEAESCGDQDCRLNAVLGRLHFADVLQHEYDLAQEGAYEEARR